MADIVERLRVLQKYLLDNDAGEAADTIEALRAEKLRLQAELAEYKRNGIVDVTGSINYHSGYDDGFRAARAAMGETE